MGDQLACPLHQGLEGGSLARDKTPGDERAERQPVQVVPGERQTERRRRTLGTLCYAPSTRRLRSQGTRSTVLEKHLCPVGESHEVPTQVWGPRESADPEARAGPHPSCPGLEGHSPSVRPALEKGCQRGLEAPERQLGIRAVRRST